MKIGVISDTHGFLDPRIHGFFAGVGHILHAGDVGPDAIIGELETIAPVTAVLGNTDTSSTFPLTETVTLDGRTFLVHHIVDPYALKEELRLRLARERPDGVVFGHTHKAFCQQINGTLFFNPGYAGKPKHGAERSVAILQVDGKEIRWEFLPL
ncbi:MAG: metallophosphoesterase family protein [Verrucomicrobiia bacterium]